MNEKNEATSEGWKFDNSYSHLPQSFYTIINPTPVRVPKLVVLNRPLAEALGLSGDGFQKEYGVSIFAGNEIPSGSLPLAQAYAGHQFGHFTMLGDGRAILLGEHINPEGERFDIQLKGSGRTPYSRRGDGRAALGPMLREYIISEAMHALGIPTTRSLAVVTTGESVYRETELPGSILTRVASSHIRVGTFQYASEWCSTEDLRTLADYTIKRHFPEIDDDENRYLNLLKGVCKRQASLIAKWQLVGFIHGVMNTDNMAISGETIDYGPCAFMDTYDPKTVFSSIDTYGRYAYGNQPTIAAWNLARFAETLLPFLHENQEEGVELAQEAISEFMKSYHKNWLEGMSAKLGILNAEQGDESLISGLLTLMEKHRADFTNTFISLESGNLSDISLFKDEEFLKWHQQWQMRLGKQKVSELSSKELMKSANPMVIPRNHRVEEALEAAVENGDYSVMDKLLEILRKPYDRSLKEEQYTLPSEPTSCRYRTFCGT